MVKAGVLEYRNEGLKVTYRLKYTGEEQAYLLTVQEKSYQGPCYWKLLIGIE
jgi:hypothetical protein